MYIKKEQQQVISDDIVDYLARLYRSWDCCFFEMANL